MPITFKNDTATPVGLWDTSPAHHVAGAFGGSVTIDPTPQSQQVIDAYVAGGAGSAVTIEIPANTVLPAITGTARVGSTLTGTNGTWSGSPTFARAWLADGVAISGATGTTYVLKAAELGKTITLRVTATNAAGNAQATSAATGAVQAALAAPVNTAVPVVSGTPTAGQALTSTTGTWTGNPTPTYVRAWLRDGTVIAGATAASYTLVADDVDANISVRVTGTNLRVTRWQHQRPLGPWWRHNMSGYGTDAEFEAWITGQGLTIPADAPAPAVLRQIGSDYVDAAYEWRLQCSRRTGGFEQERAWPRTGHRVNGQALPDDLIPPAWVQASYRAAYLTAVTPGWASGGTNPGRLTKREKVDVIEREFFAPGDSGASPDTAPGMPFDAVINGLILPWLCSATRRADTLFRVI